MTASLNKQQINLEVSLVHLTPNPIDWTTLDVIQLFPTWQIPESSGMLNLWVYLIALLYIITPTKRTFVMRYIR